jgi:hypothetical protein
MSDDDNKTESKSKLWERGIQILALLVIPLVLWGAKLEVNNAVQNERIAELRKELDKTKELDLSEAKDMKKTITDNTHALIRLETKMDTVSTTLTDIKGLLRAP